MFSLVGVISMYPNKNTTSKNMVSCLCKQTMCHGVLGEEGSTSDLEGGSGGVSRIREGRDGEEKSF